MSVRCFVDTNVLVYARDASEKEKQPLALQWISRLWRERTGRTSIQVLNEYYVTVTSKLSPGLASAEAWADVCHLLAWHPVPLGRFVMEKAREAQEAWGLSWWDCLIVAAAQVSGCALLVTEDLQDGQDLAGVRIVDPFRHSPAELLA